MDIKIGQKEKPKFAPPSAREKQHQGNETSKSKKEETKNELKIHTAVDEITTVRPTAEEKSLPVEQKTAGIKKATNVNEKHKLLEGFSKKGAGEEHKEEKGKNVITQRGQAGCMENSVASQSLQDDGTEREVIEKKKTKKIVKNKWQELATGEDKDTDEVTCSAQKGKEKKRRKKAEDIPKIKEKQEQKEKTSVTLTDSQYEDIFDSVLGAAQLETCMEDARAMLSEVELLQASIDQEVNKTREKEEENGDICQEREEDEWEIQEDRKEETHQRHKGKKEKGAKIGSQKRRRVEEDDYDSETDEYDSWVQCSRAECKKWRRLQDNTDPSTLSKSWTCCENTDPARSSCDAPEESWSLSKEEEFYYCSLVPGSLVWAQQTGYPWWPAMIERDPVTSDFLLFKTRRDPFPFKCHVTYFGSPVSRAWVQRCRIRDYNDLLEQAALNMVRHPVYKKKLKDAIKMSGQAQKLPLQKRLNRFGFMTRRARDGKNVDEDSDMEEILALIAESSEKASEKRKRTKDSGHEEMKCPQKPRKHLEEIPAALKKQDKNTESKEEGVEEQQECPMTESDGQAVPESAVETSVEIVPGLEDIGKGEKTPREEAEQMQKKIDGEQKTENAIPVELEESMREGREEEQTDEEKGDADEAAVGKDKAEERLDTALDIMAWTDDLMKRLCAEEEEKEDELTVLFEE